MAEQGKARLLPHFQRAETAKRSLQEGLGVRRGAGQSRLTFSRRAAITISNIPT